MVSATTARRILMAVAEALPTGGHDVVTRVDIRDGWGGAVHVRVHSMLGRSDDEQLLSRVRKSVEQVVDVPRHRVEIVWGSSG